MRPGLLLIASNFPPAANAGVYRTLRFARYLSEMGWGVRVVAMDPARMPGSSVDEALAERLPGAVEVERTAAIYPLEWLNRLRRPRRAGGSANGNGRAVRKPAEAKPTALERIKDAVSIPLMTPDRHIGWIPFAVRAGRRAVRRNGIDAIYSSGPPWTNHLVGHRLKRSTGLPWVADFRDPWVGADFRGWRRGNTWAARRHQQLERRVVEAADRIVANTPRSGDDLVARYADELAGKLAVIPNGFDPSDYDWVPESPPRAPSRKLVMAHAGSFYGKRNVNGLIEAVGNLCRNGALPPGALEVRLIGALRPGRSEEEARVKAAGVEEVVRLTPRVSHDECLRQLAAADVLLLVQVGAPLSVPGKAYEYIALGKTILTVAHPGATTDLMEREQLGAWVSPDDVAGLEEAVMRLYRGSIAPNGLPGVPGAVRDRYDGRRLTGCLDELLRQLIVA